MVESQENVKYEAVAVDIEDVQEDLDSQADVDLQNDESDSDITQTKYECYEKVRQILSKLSRKTSDESKKKLIKEMKVSNRFKQILEGYTLPIATDKGKPDYYINLQTFLLEKCKNEIFAQDKKEQIFFAAALLQQKEVDALFPSLEESKLDYVRDHKTVIHFILKYGNLGNPDIVQCVQKFIGADVDLDVCDFDGFTALDQVLRLYQICCRKENASNENKKQNLKDIAQALIDSNRCYTDNNVRWKLKEMMNIEVKAFCSSEDVDKITRIFNLVIKQNHEGIKKICLETSEVINSNNGEDTLLQLACKKNNLKIIKCLLEHGADPNKSTTVNPVTPLELCALRNYKESFVSILNSTHKITEEQFRSFVKKRVAMKTYYFNHLLESEKLDDEYKFKNNYNTPLHYAIFFSQSNAIQKLLKRGASLFEKNLSGNTSLQIIDYSDLKTYFDSCIILDKHNTHISDPNYKIQFDFSCFFATKKTERNSREFCEDGDEWEVIYQIGENERLENLLKHPLIYTFLSMKWLEAQRYFYLIFALQTFIYFPLFIMFFFLDKPSFALLLVTFLGSLCNFIKIFAVLITHKEVSNTSNSNQGKCWSISTILENFSTNISYSFSHATFHCFLEVLVTIQMLTVCILHYRVPRHNPTIAYSAEIRAFIFVGIVLIWLLTLGYHPRVSKWSVMLRKIYKTFSALILVLSFPIIAFAMGFHTLWTSLNQNKIGSTNVTFVTLPSSIFKTYIMSTGDLSLDYDRLEGFAIYFYYILFAISMAIILMNFFLAVACRDMNDMEKNSELNSIKNIIIFLYFVDSFYRVCSTLSITVYCMNVMEYFEISELNPFRTPLMLSKIKPKNKSSKRMNKDDVEKQRLKDVELRIDFFVSKPKQFSFNNSREARKKIDGACLDKIKKYIIDKKVAEKVRKSMS